MAKEALTQQEHNMKLRELAMSYLPGTKQFEDTYAADYDVKEDDDAQTEMMNDIVLGVDTEVSKIVWLTVGGPTTYLEFKFEGTKCNFDTFKRAYLHTTAIEYESTNNTDTYEYSTPDGENLYYAYEQYICDYE